MENKSRGKIFLTYFFRHRLGVIGLFGVVFVFMVALFAPFLAQEVSGYGEVSDIMLAPSMEHLFGTDSMGLDVFSQVVWGTRTSIKVGFMVVLYASLVGVPIGLLSGYFGGIIETLGMGLADIFLTLPVLPLMIIMAAVMGPDINNVAFVIGILGWPKLARVTRASTLEVANMQYIEAAKCLGIRGKSILFKHVLVNASAPILVNMTLAMASAILSESGLSFLGLGDPLVWSWGKILENAHQSGAFISAWWCSFFPSVAIILFVISFNFLGMGIREALNPKLRKM